MTDTRAALAISIGLGVIMLGNPRVAEWFILCAVALVLIFAPIAAIKSWRSR